MVTMLHLVAWFTLCLSWLCCVDAKHSGVNVIRKGGSNYQHASRLNMHQAAEEYRCSRTKSASAITQPSIFYHWVDRVQEHILQNRHFISELH